LPDVARSIVYVHPFAEEMNKSRRMAALQSRALAAAGWVVLQLDLFGCGDSEGDFGQAGWSHWLDDIRAAVEWLRAETGTAPALWGLRAGGLLAAQALAGTDPAPSLLLWQPVISGKKHLQQFLRMNVAGQLSNAAGSPRVGTQQLREQFEQGQIVEVGGYATAPAMALGMETAELLPPLARTRVAWLEVAAGTELQLSPASSRQVEMWRGAGHRVDVRIVEGLPFWQTQEIAECPALIEATLQALDAWRQ
jgi:exosortase A-associated hydrolase 2